MREPDAFFESAVEWFRNHFKDKRFVYPNNDHHFLGFFDPVLREPGVFVLTYDNAIDYTYPTENCYTMIYRTSTPYGVPRLRLSVLDKHCTSTRVSMNPKEYMLKSASELDEHVEEIDSTVLYLDNFRIYRKMNELRKEMLGTD